MEYVVTSLTGPVFEELIHLIHSFTDENFNTRPSTGGWSAGQVAEHIRLSAGDVVQLFNGGAFETDRDPEMNIAPIRNLFMDFDSKFESPESIVPADKDYGRGAFVSYFHQLSAEIDEAVAQLDMSCTCSGFELPGFGLMTRVEWIAFVVYHTQRHIHQMRKLSQKI